MQQIYSDLQLDALRELANIGSGTAATALSSMLGRPVDVSVPSAVALPLADAVDAAGPPESEVTAVVLPIHGDIDAHRAAALPARGRGAASASCSASSRTRELGRSALGEIGNILGSSYVGALGDDDRPRARAPPAADSPTTCSARSSHGARLGAEATDVAFVLDSDLIVEGTECSLSFMLVPSRAGVAELLRRLGL